MKYSTIIKIIFFYCVFFIILYFEGRQVGGIKLSQLWKMPLIGYMIIYVIIKHKRTYKFNKLAYSYGFIKLFNPGIFNTLMLTIADCIRFITFPFLFDYLKSKLKDTKAIKNLLFYISQFVILSFIPFLFHILAPAHQEVYIDSNIQEMYAEAGKTSGLFLKSHGASEILSLCLIIIIYKLQQEKKIKFLKAAYYVFLIAIGIWALVMTYARGGWAMFTIGLIILLFKMNRKYILGGISIFFICFIGINYLMQTNETFYNRITDKDSSGNQQEEVGSGRLEFAKNGIEFWANSTNFQQFLTGQGYDKLTDYQKEKAGIKIYCHNGYVDALAQNGILGFIFLILSTIYIFTYIYKNKNEKDSRFVFAIFSMRVIFQLVQGGASPYTDLIYALALCLLVYRRKEHFQKTISQKMINRNHKNYIKNMP